MFSAAAFKAPTAAVAAATTSTARPVTVVVPARSVAASSVATAAAAPGAHVYGAGFGWDETQEDDNGWGDYTQLRAASDEQRDLELESLSQLDTELEQMAQGSEGMVLEVLPLCF